MKKKQKSKSLEAVERERERESYTLFKAWAKKPNRVDKKRK